jgi:hypothetical protein
MRLTVLPIALAASLALAGAVLAALDPGNERPEARQQPKVKPRPAPQAAFKGTGIIRLGSTFHAAGGYDRYSYIITDVNDALAAGVRKYPGKTLVYMNGLSLPDNYSTGVPLQQAVARDWVLKDANGANIVNVAYGHVLGDFGNPAYQRAFVANVAAFLKRTKNDGIFLDDVIGAPVSFTGGPLPARYPTPDAWENAMVSFVAAAGKGLQARGYYLLVNPSKFVSGDVRSDTAELMTGFWRRLAPHVDGFMSEYWMQNAVDITQRRAIGPAWYENWTGWQSLQRVAQSAGTDFFALFYATTTNVPAMRYARGVFLLDWNGRGGALMFEPTDRADPFHPMWVKQVGLPVSSKSQRRPGVWQRRFQKALVIVNATTQPTTVRIDGVAHTIAATDALFAAPARKR